MHILNSDRDLTCDCCGDKTRKVVTFRARAVLGIFIYVCLECARAMKDIVQNEVDRG
jgi:predicted nucleic acid-binding Zn ribbon protein